MVFGVLCTIFFSAVIQSFEDPPIYLIIFCIMAFCFLMLFNVLLSYMTSDVHMRFQILKAWVQRRIDDDQLDSNLLKAIQKLDEDYERESENEAKD